MTKNETLRTFIQEKRPKLSSGSITTYASLLSSIYKQCFPDDKTIDTSKFNDTSIIMQHLHSVAPNSRKTRLSALYVVTGNKAYVTQMDDDIKTYDATIAQQNKSAGQEANWIPYTEVVTTLETLKHNADLLYKKKELNSNDLQNIQQYIILCLMSGVYIAPRRSLDYCSFKIRGEFNHETDNYIEKGNLVFNRYKTDKFKGQQQVKIPIALGRILRRWITVNPTDTLFFDINNAPLTNVKFNQRLNKIFGKKIATNMLRHIYLTTKFQSTIKQNEDIANTMEQMGSSSNMLDTYVKK